MSRPTDPAQGAPSTPRRAQQPPFASARSSALALLLAGALTLHPALAAPPTPTAPVDAASAELESYLAAHKLDALLAEQLVQRLPHTSGEEKNALIQRLGKLYVDLLGSAGAQSDRDYWQERARELVKLAPEALTFELRMNLLRAQYAQAEETSERIRLALDDAEKKAGALAQMRTVRAEFDRLAAELVRRVTALESTDFPNRDPALVQQDIAEARRLRSVAFYYAGWAAYYQAFLSGGAGGDSAASDALRSFSWIVGRSGPAGGREVPSLVNVPARQFKFEHVARAGVGVALAFSLARSDAEAIRWLDALADEPELTPAVKETLLPRRIAILAAAGRWSDLRAAIDAARRGPTPGDFIPLPTSTARLLAVIGLENRGGEKAAADLAQVALGDLVARQEVAQVLDLAKRFGTAPLGDTGFIVHYVRGVQGYEKVVAEHRAGSAESAEEPASDPAIINQFRAAAQELDLATRQADAGAFTAAHVRAVTLAGRALYFAGDFAASADRFLAASSAAAALKNAALEEENLWLAVITLDRGSREKNAGAATLGSRADELTALFLKSFPRSSRTPQLVLRRSESGGIKDEQAIGVLLNVPPSDAAYDPARRQLVRLLYRVYRAAGSESRAFAAARFVPIAQEVFAADRRAALSGDARRAADATPRLLITARQLLDTLLGGPVPDAPQAQTVLDDLQSVIQYNSVPITDIEDELAYRRFQLALLKRDWTGAEDLAERLQQWGSAARAGAFASASPANASGKPSRFALSAQRSLYLRALDDYRRATLPRSPAAAPADSIAAAISVNLTQTALDLTPAPAPAALTAARNVVRFGARIIDSMVPVTPSPGAPASAASVDPATLSLWSSVAAAAFDLYRAQRDPASLELARSLDQRILAAAPSAGDSVRRLAIASESAGDIPAALASWQTLAGGLDPSTPGFFEAKFHLVRLLVPRDSAQAARIMIQHATLFPEFGPAPWGPRLRVLYQSLREAVDDVLLEETRKHQSGAPAP